MRNRRLDEYLRRAAREVRGGSVDVEVLLRKLAEAVVDEVLSRRGSVGTDGGQAGIEAIAERLSRLEEQVEQLVSIVLELREAVNRISSLREQGVDRPSTAGYEQEDAGSRHSTSGEIVDLVRKKCYVFMSEERLNPRDVDYTSLLSKGIVVIELGSDIVLADRACLKEFLSRLEAVATSDEREAAQLLGRYSSLFRALRTEGLVIYSSSQRRWVAQAELQKMMMMS